ncbi:MAG: hypothetical protein HY306_06010 [Nitrosomonadales bacterium]|nr:hypothetical protein [Nitrosomonadales bacterium]
MTISDDFSISSAKDIRHAGAGATVWSGLAFHAWLQSIAMLSQPVGDDTMSMVK